MVAMAKQAASQRPDQAVDHARVSTESIRVIAQSMPNLLPLSEPAATALAPDAEYRLREIIQDSVKFMKHSKRAHLTTNDINAALRLRNIEPIYGFSSRKRNRDQAFARDNSDQGDVVGQPLPVAAPAQKEGQVQTTFKQAEGIPELFFIEDSEESIKSMLEAPFPELPLEVTISAHWLAIDGIQPSIPQNPSKRRKMVPEVKDAAKLEAATTPNLVPAKVGAEVKSTLRHELSKELQLYFEHLTHVLYGEDAAQFDACLESVSEDDSIAQLLPYLTFFISDTVNKYKQNLPLMVSCMRLVGALLRNPIFQLELYLHQLLPAILTCLVGRRLCASPRDNHWTLRDYTAVLVGRICRQFGKDYQTLQPRITRTLVDALDNVKRPLTTHYGAILGLSSLGKRVVDLLLRDRLGGYASKIKKLLKDPKQKEIRKYEASKVLGAMVWAVSPSERPASGVATGGTPELPLAGQPIVPEVTISKQAFAEIVQGSQSLVEELEQGLGSGLYPFRLVKTEADLAKATRSSRDN